MGYVAARIEELKTHLASLPPVDPSTREITKLEAIRRLSSEIAGLQKKGYTIDEVAQFITDQGVPITGATLKQYLYRLKAKRARRRGEQPGENPSPTTEEVTATLSKTPGAAAVNDTTNTSSPAVAPRAHRATPPATSAQPAVNTQVNDPPQPPVNVVAATSAPPAAQARPQTSVPATTSSPHQEPRPAAAAGSFVPREDSTDL